MKRSYILLSTLLFVVIFSIFSINMAETNLYSSNLNKLKYLYLQTNIHMKNIKLFIKTHNHTQIINLKLDDKRYNLRITFVILKKDNILYNVFIKTKDDTPISLYDTINKLY